MATCTVTFNLQDANGAFYASGTVGYAPIVAFDTATGRVLTELERLPLGNSPLSKASFEQGKQFGFLLPDGSTEYRQIPAAASANYTDLALTIPVPPAPAVTYPAATIDTLLAAKAGPAELATKVGFNSIDAEKLKVSDYAKWRPLLTALLNRDTAKVDIGVMGPSTVAGYLATWASSIPQAMSRRLRQRFPTTGISPQQGGTGFIPIPDEAIRGVTATASPQSSPWSFTAGMQFDTTAFASGVNHTIAYTNGAEYGQVTTDRDLTHIKVRHLTGTAGLAATGFLKAGTNPTVSFSTAAGATTPKDELITGVQLGFPSGVIPAGTTLYSGGLNTGGYFINMGIEGFYNDTAKGVHVHQIGHCGFDTSDWEQTVAGGTTRADIASLGLDFLFLAFYGINAGSTGRTYASGGSRTAAQWKAEMVAHIAWLRAGGVNCNVALVASYDPTGGVALADPWSSYVTAMKEIAAADSTVAFVDLSLRMPLTGSASATAWGLYQPDKVHLQDAGNLMVADILIDHTLAQLEGGPVGDALQRKADLVGGKVPASQLPSSVTRTVYAAAQSATPIAIPVGTTTLRVRLRGGGGGGGSGRKGAAGAVRTGGAGGGGGGYDDIVLDAAAYAGTTVYLWVGAGGAGAAAQTTNSTNGSAGTDGSPSFLTTSSSAVLATARASAIAFVSGGLSGGAGSAATSTGGVAGNGGTPIVGTGGSSTNSASGVGVYGGGGSGGAISAANTALGGGNAVVHGGVNVGVATVSGGETAGGANTGVAGAAASTVAAGTNGPRLAPGGAGGGASNTGAAGTGGAGVYGSGGGGGGASVDSVGNSGAGGNGGTGWAVLETV